MIKKIIIALSLFLALACNKKENAKIGVRLSNSINQMAYLEEIRVSGKKIIDSVKVKKNGRINFRFQLKEPGYYLFRLEDDKSLTLVVSPSEKIKIEADYNRFFDSKKINGSENSTRLNILHDSLRNAIYRMSKIETSFQDADSNQKAILAASYDKIIHDHHKFSLGFILENLSSLSNIGALYQEYSPGTYVMSQATDLQFYKLVSDSLGKYYPKVRYVKALRDNYQILFSNYQQQKLLKLAGPAQEYLPDLTLPSRKGMSLSLSSLRGKIVLLTFWSYKQNESIQNSIELKKVYSKYRNRGFDIYQVSVDQSITEWEKALNFEEIPWPSVCDTASSYSITASLYNVNTIPMNYLLNVDQTKVLAKNLSASALDQKLSKLLK